MFRKKGTADKRQLLEGVHLSTLVHGEKTLMGQFSIAKESAIPPHSHPHEQTGFMVSEIRVKSTFDSCLNFGKVKRRLDPHFYICKHNLQAAMDKEDCRSIAGM